VSTGVDGPLLFARFAYPPNALGYCGPADSDAVLQHAAAGVSDGHLRLLAAGFAGAWPYLQLIAGANGLVDPLAPAVVEAYWIGNRLLDRVGSFAFGRSLEDRFEARTGRSFPRLVEAVPAGALPHHSFHVFGVYPWVGLLRSGSSDQALTVLDRCRIRWGQVQSVGSGSAVVISRPLVWDGHRLELGTPRPENVLTGVAGGMLTPDIAVGEWYALHWDWLCERLSPQRLSSLRHYSGRQLDLVNGLAFPAPATVLS
jgi:hypothetical protein